jgi:PqqD family protein of HPr-rel-A system
MAEAWVLADAGGTALHFFEDACTVFNPVRWETHVVDLLVGTLLEELREGARTEVALARVTVDASDLDEMAAAQFVRDALLQLSALELVVKDPGRAHR